MAGGEPDGSQALRLAGQGSKPWAAPTHGWEIREGFLKHMCLAFSLFMPSVVLAQQSANYRLAEHAFNAASHPIGGIVLSSTSYLVRLDASGDSVAGISPASTSFLVDGGFVARYPAPTAVSGARFVDRTSLAWDAERSAGVYNVYRDLLSTLPGSFGSCWQNAIPGTSVGDVEEPLAETVLFYLVTAENRLGEEGTKGQMSSGAQRPNLAPCP